MTTSVLIVAFLLTIRVISSSVLALNTSADSLSSNSIPRPKCVVFDLDKTLWKRPRFRKGPPFTPIEDGLSGVRAASGEVLDLYPDVRGVLLSLKGQEITSSSQGGGASIKIAFVSRTHREEWSKLFLKVLSIREENEIRKVIEFCDVLVIRDGPKSKMHLREVARALNLNMKDLIFFDDREHEIRDAKSACGVLGVHCPDGLNWEKFNMGLKEFARLRSTL
jgi:magnesium-dependent phosphatase-1